MQNLFKGYVATKNKKCLTAFKGKSAAELLTLDEAEKLTEYAGILDDNTVLIDVDNYEESETLMYIVEKKQTACKVYETTRGKHFLFLNGGRINKNYTNALLACGIHADIKSGARTSYSVLKFKDKPRNIIYDIYPDEEYTTVPKWLLPIKSKTDFAAMDTGDGRNQALFNYILTLQSAGYSKEEARETIEIINDHILKTPLPQKELETILRDDAFQAPVFYDGSKFLHDKFALFLISEYNIIKIAGVLHSYVDGVYVPSNIETLIIKHLPTLKRQQRQEVIYFLNAYISKNTTVSDANYIAFKNGVYNVFSGVLEPFTKDKILTNKINWNYNPAAYDALTDDVLNRLACGNASIRALINEMIGYCFYRRNELRKAFMLKGERQNGKSTFMDMLAYLLGENNISSLDLADLSHEYKASGLFGKLANLGDDIEDEFIPSAGIFKKVVSGDRMNTNVKYSAPIEFNPYCKLIFSGNSIPRLGRGRDSAAIIDRLIIVPFNARFNRNTEGFSPFIKYQLRTPAAMEYLIKIGLEGLARVLERNAFTECEQTRTEIEEYEEILNPIKLFFEEMGDSLENEATKKAYRRYNEFCIENALKPVSQVEFSKQVNKQFGYETVVKRINGKGTRVFVKRGVNNGQ